VKRCLDCGGEVVAGQCAACGLTTVAAELLFRRRLLNRTAVFLLGAVAFVAAGHFYPPLELDAMLIFIGVVFFVTLGLAIWLDRRGRRTGRVEIPKRIYYALVPIPWLLAVLLFVNGRFDSEPPVSRVVEVVGKFTMPGTLRSSRLVVRSWRPGRRVERVPVTRDDYLRFQRGDVIEVREQGGLVGIPWVYSVHRK